ncbi:uncharacterized protein N0V89_006865 [Didymosphaeria variabile]|uniref:Uncharacterized protein n=1 Tax=Didymosphaeria variabile TaxID=1932322 RepID=A0A9W9C9X8_9PLEO|nr:uncharacterized protein N0V89_006865 [Didymosphaeria variabile]KAJ4351522.1 hypothetical protein N0V89_006865 [Didymosphaeria variabile]
MDSSNDFFELNPWHEEAPSGGFPAFPGFPESVPNVASDYEQLDETHAGQTLSSVSDFTNRHQMPTVPWDTFFVAGQEADTTPSQAGASHLNAAPSENLLVAKPAAITSSKKRVSRAASTPAKKQKTAKLDTGRANVKPRMMGKKGLDEGFVPKWDSMKVYGEKTLRYKIGLTKIKKFLTDEGVDVDTEFPTTRMVYNGKETTKGQALVDKARELQQARIDQKLANSHAAARPRNSRRQPLTFGGDVVGAEHLSEIDHDKGHELVEGADKSETWKDNDHNSELDGVCETDDEHVAGEKSERVVVSTTRSALRALKKATLKSGFSSPDLVLDGLDQPLLSLRAQEIVPRLVKWQEKNRVFRFEAGDGALYLGARVLNKEDRGAYEKDLEDLATELVQVAKKDHDDKTATKVGKLAFEEFSVEP